MVPISKKKITKVYLHYTLLLPLPPPHTHMGVCLNNVWEDIHQNDKRLTSVQEAGIRLGLNKLRKVVRTFSFSELFEFFHGECIHILFVKLNIHLKYYINKALQCLNVNKAEMWAFLSLKRRLKTTLLPRYIVQTVTQSRGWHRTYGHNRQWWGLWPTGAESYFICGL